LVTANYWDNLLRLVSASYPDGSTISNVYTALDVTAHKDRLNQWSYFGFNGIRQMVAATNENGVVTRYGYCDCGALLSQTNAWSTPVQQVINFSYDYQGNLWKTAYPDAYCVTNWFDSLQRVTTTGDGTTYRYLYYNNQGLITNVSNSLGAERKTTFDIEDRSIYVTDINGVSVTNAFDDLNRLRTRVYPDGGVEKFGYSARGLIAYTNQLNLTNFFVYDEGSRKTFETNANGEIIRYTNSPAGDLLSLTDGKNQTTRWHYDEYGRVTNKVDQAGTEILRYGYDADSRLTNRWSAAKGNTAYTFDPVGNVTLINYPSSPDVTFKWDWLNRLTNMVDASGTNKYTYTAGNQLLTDDGPFASDTITNTYVNRLRTRLDLQQPTGLWTNLFAYDAARRLTNVISPAGAFGYQFVPSGVTHHASRITLPNSAYITNVYDGNARLTATYLKNSGNTTLDSYLYVYDPANERTNLTRADASTVAYAYDKIGQLKIADSSVNSEDRGYTYDAAWNLSYRTNNGVAAGFGVDSKNQLTSEGGFPCTYDSNGNLTQIGNSLSSIGIMVYSYDDENRLTEVYTNYNSPGQGPVTAAWQTDFVYDGLGRMRKRLDYAGGLLQGTTLYIYDGWRVIQERDGATGTPIASFTRGSDLSGSLEGAGGIGGLLARSDTYSGGNWGTHDYYFADGNGNITYLVDSSQSLAASYRYDPFGNVISSSGPLWALNRYRFSSKEIHVGSGMYYYGFRFYDPNLQRWINRDPLGDNESLKVRNGPSIAGEGVFGPRAYGFVYNNPVRYIDRNGLWGVAFGNDSGSSYFNVGVGSPSLYFSPDALHGLGESAAATADGLNPVGNPFANNGFYNPNDPNNRFSHGAGKIAQVCLTTAAGLGALKAANAALMPQTLYHFTSVEGAAGIAANGGIDATSGLYGYGTYLSGFNNAAMAALQGASATDVAVPVAAEGLSISATYFPGTYIVEGASVLVP
jgi:RHS repeat-associated protein